MYFIFYFDYLKSLPEIVLDFWYLNNLGIKFFVRSPVFQKYSNVCNIVANFNILEQHLKFYTQTIDDMHAYMTFLCNMYALFDPITHPCIHVGKVCGS
jgi:hypothetical protein